MLFYHLFDWYRWALELRQYDPFRYRRAPHELLFVFILFCFGLLCLLSISISISRCGFVIIILFGGSLYLRGNLFICSSGAATSANARPAMHFMRIIHVALKFSRLFEGLMLKARTIFMTFIKIFVFEWSERCNSIDFLQDLLFWVSMTDSPPAGLWFHGQRVHFYVLLESPITILAHKQRANLSAYKSKHFVPPSQSFASSNLRFLVRCEGINYRGRWWFDVPLIAWMSEWWRNDML